MEHLQRVRNAGGNAGRCDQKKEALVRIGA
jgi:hypothetical protein